MDAFSGKINLLIEFHNNCDEYYPTVDKIIQHSTEMLLQNNPDYVSEYGDMVDLAEETQGEPSPHLVNLYINCISYWLAWAIENRGIPDQEDVDS